VGDTATEAPDLTVVLPAHNEANLLEATVETIVTWLEKNDRSYEVIIVENGSTDGTLSIAQALAADNPAVHAISNTWADYGDALAKGFTAARGTTVVNFDVDYYDFDFLEKAEERLARDDVAIVVASKTAPGAVDRRPLLRRVLTAGFTTALKLGFALPVSDAHGMKLLRREPLVPIAEACKMHGSLFDVELVLRASAAGLGAAEIPAIVEEMRPPRTAVWRRSIESLTGLVKLRSLLWRERRSVRTLPGPARRSADARDAARGSA
jgi:glycosyltransferase involved in cell wall biosynthesis